MAEKRVLPLFCKCLLMFDGGFLWGLIQTDTVRPITLLAVGLLTLKPMGEYVLMN